MESSRPIIGSRMWSGRRPRSELVLESRHDSGISLGPVSPLSSSNNRESPKFVFNSNVTSTQSHDDHEEEPESPASPAVSETFDSHSSSDRLAETTTNYTGTGNVSPIAFSTRHPSHSSVDDDHNMTDPPVRSHTGTGTKPVKTQPEFIRKIQGAFNSLSKHSPKGLNATRLPEEHTPGSKDKKLMAILIAKKEEAARQERERENAHWRWEEEQRSLAEHRRRRSSKMDIPSSEKPPRSADPRRQIPLNQGEITPTSILPPHSTCSSRPRSVMGDVTPIETKTPTKSKDKFIAANEKKRSVEQRLEQQRREMEEHQRQLREKQEEDLQRANSIRMSREQQIVLRTKLRNLETQQRQEKRNQLKQQSMEDLSARQTALQEKLQLADLKVQQKRHQESRRNRQDIQRKIDQSRQRQQQIEDELKTWQQELLRFKEWQGKNAEKVAKENVAKRSETACRERLEKEKLQREKMNRLLAEEDEWLTSVEDTINAKDERSKTILKQKEEYIQKTRASASAYQRLREDMRTHYSMNDLDILSKQAALENRLVAKGQTSTEQRHLQNSNADLS